MQKINFITYSEGKEFEVSKKHIISLAKFSGFFEECIPYSFRDLDSEFKKKYSDILKMQRGAGYWLWKLNIIEKSLKSMNNNDILVYSDAGSSFNLHAKKRFNEYIDLLNSQNIYGNLRFECEPQHIENLWTSKELFDYFNIKTDSQHALSTQLEAGHMIFKKTEHTLELLKSFHKVLDHDIELITDKYNHTTQIANFMETRHDQSIWSLLSKIEGSIWVKNETDFKERQNQQYEYPFLAVRRKGHGLRDRIFYKFLKYHKQNKPEYFKI